MFSSITAGNSQERVAPEIALSGDLSAYIIAWLPRAGASSLFGITKQNKVANDGYMHDLRRMIAELLMRLNWMTRAGMLPATCSIQAS